MHSPKQPPKRTKKQNNKIKCAPGSFALLQGALLLWKIKSGTELFFVVLQGVQLIVPPMTGQQLLVAALLQNFAVGQHD